MRCLKSLKLPLRLALLAGALFMSKSTFVAAQPVTADPSTLTGRQQSQAIIHELLQNGRIIRSSDVKRGMRGYGLSVFQGTKIEKFSIEVLGVLQKVQGGGDVVLIKVLDGPVVQRQSGIIAGMSGSPVYINGKMLGAIALGWGFPKEPIGGVTPITEMIRTTLPQDMSAPKVAALSPATSKTPDVYVPRQALQINGKNISRIVVPKNHTRVALNAAQQDTEHHSGSALMRRTSTLLQVSGFSQEALPKLKKIFEPYGLEPFIGPSSKKTGVPSPKLEPGSAVGVQLVSGDMDQTAVGTITFRWGNRVLAFGHPMFGLGNASLPMASAYVHEIFPSYQRSFKLASPIDVVGAVQQDTQFAIGGTVHAKADTIPMRVKLEDADRQIDKTFNVQIMNDPLLTPQLAVLVAQEAVTSTLGLTSDKMVEVGLRMDVVGAAPIVRHNLLYSSSIVSQAALMDLMQSISLVQSNQFAKGKIRNIALDVKVKPGRKIAIVKSLTANRNKVKAGESLQVNVVLQPSANPTERITRTFTFKVPEDAPAGNMRLVAASSANFWPMQVAVGGPAPDPASLPELIAAWNKVGALNELTVMASMPQRFLRVDQQNVQNPPASWLRLLGSSPSTGAESYNEVSSQHSTLDYAIDGAKILRIPVESAQKSADDDASSNSSDSDDSGLIDSDSDSSATSGLEDAPEEAPSAPPDASTNDAAAKSTLGSNNLHWTSTTNWNNLSWPEKTLLQVTPPTTPAPGSSSAAATSSTTKTNSSSTTTTATTSSTSTESTDDSTPTTISKTLGRPALNWVDTGAADFLKGEFNGAVVGSDGIIRLAPTSKQLATTPLPFIWSITGDKQHNVYMGTGAENEARLYRVNSAGEQSLFFSTTGIAITALTVDSADNVYAAVSPGGKIYRITPNGNSQLVLNTEQSFVWAMNWDANQQLLIGTGGEHGELFRIDPTQPKSTFTAQPLHTFKEGHVRALAVAADGTVYAGTGSAGVLYKVNAASGDVTALYEVTEGDVKQNGEILAVTATADGVYFGTSSNGTLYRWTAEDGVIALYPSPQKAVYALAQDSDGNIFMATGDKGVVYRLQPGKDVQTTKAARILEPTQLQSLSLFLVQGEAERLLVGTGNNGAAFEIPLANASTGTFTSRIYDTKRKVEWGAIRAVKQNVVIQTRSGNTTTPDATWSDWATAKALPGGELQVASPPSRFLQYKVLLQGDATPAPGFARIAISYLTGNQPPKLVVTAPKGGEYWSGKKSITWTGADPDKDTLRYTIDLINGKEESKPATEDPVKTSPFSLDTKKWADGSYIAKVEASDILSNPLDPQSISMLTLPFVIDNTAPTITGARVETADDTHFIKARITDQLSPIVGVKWRVATPKPTTEAEKSTDEKVTKDASKAADTKDTAKNSTTDDKSDKDDSSDSTDSDSDDSSSTDTTKKNQNGWHALSAQDGLFDSLSEQAIGIISLNEKEKSTLDGKPLQIELRAQDAAGNTLTITLEVKL